MNALMVQLNRRICIFFFLRYLYHLMYNYLFNKKQIKFKRSFFLKILLCIAKNDESHSFNHVAFLWFKCVIITQLQHHTKVFNNVAKILTSQR